MTATSRHDADAAFGRALQGRGFGTDGSGAPKAKPPAIVAKPVMPADAVYIGDADDKAPVWIDLTKLIEGRLLIQGLSGSGKSWTLRRLLEQTAGKIQQIVIDPEDEFGNLACKYGLVHVDAHLLDIAALEIAAGRAREHRVSMVLNFSQLDRTGQMKAIAAFLPALIEAPREQWHPCLVAIDEAQLFAPFGGTSEDPIVRKASIAAVVDLANRGRKRGLACVLATLRLQRLATSATAEVTNAMIGQNTLDRDISRAAETIGWSLRRASDRLPLLESGDFISVGRAFSRSPATLHVGQVETKHRGATPLIVAPPTIDGASGAMLLDIDALISASETDAQSRDETARPASLRNIRAFIRDEAFPNAGRVWGELKKLAPKGAFIGELAKHLNRKRDEITAALALLDNYGVLEFTGDGDQRAVRISDGMS